jgi:hypothetical protein
VNELEINVVRPRRGCRTRPGRNHRHENHALTARPIRLSARAGRSVDLDAGQSGQGVLVDYVNARDSYPHLFVRARASAIGEVENAYFFHQPTDFVNSVLAHRS